MTLTRLLVAGGAFAVAISMQVPLSFNLNGFRCERHCSCEYMLLNARGGSISKCNAANGERRWNNGKHKMHILR